MTRVLVFLGAGVVALALGYIAAAQVAGPSVRTETFVVTYTVPTVTESTTVTETQTVTVTSPPTTTTTTAAPPPPPSGNVLYRQNWEHPDFDGVDGSQWVRQCENIEGEPIASRGTHTKVTSPVAQGSFAGRFDLPPSTTGGRSACELLHARKLNHGTHDYYALAVRFPADWREPSSAHWGSGISQFNYQGIKSGAVALHAHADHVGLVTESGFCGNNSAGVFECQYRTGNGIASGPLGHHYAIPRERFAKDVWHELVVHVLWTSDPSVGVVEVFHRRLGESAWVRTTNLTGLATVQWRSGYDPTGDHTTNDKMGHQRGQASFTSSLFHDAWCRATSFAAAESCLR